MSFRDELLHLGHDAEAAVVEVYRRYREGIINHDTAVDLLVAIIEKYQLRATALADLSLSTILSLDAGTIVPAQATVPPLQAERLARSATTVLAVAERSDVPDAIIARLARAETFTAGQDAYATGIARSSRVKGWIRGVSPGCCQLCRWWWREGRVWPHDHRMPTHKGCTCHPVPVVRDHIKSTGYTRKLAREAATKGLTE